MQTNYYCLSKFYYIELDSTYERYYDGVKRHHCAMMVMIENVNDDCCYAEWNGRFPYDVEEFLFGGKLYLSNDFDEAIKILKERHALSDVVHFKKIGE